MGGEVDIAGRSFSSARASIVVNLIALNAFMQSVLDLWGDSEYVRHSLLSQHHCK